MLLISFGFGDYSLRLIKSGVFSEFCLFGVVRVTGVRLLRHPARRPSAVCACIRSVFACAVAFHLARQVPLAASAARADLHHSTLRFVHLWTSCVHSHLVPPSTLPMQASRFTCAPYSPFLSLTLPNAADRQSVSLCWHAALRLHVHQTQRDQICPSSAA